MKKDSQKWSATPSEFLATTDTEFGFLVSEHGYQRVIHPKDPFTIEFRRNSLCIRVTGINYGFGAHLDAYVDGQFLPLWPVMTNLSERKTPQTDEPQLDDLREYAWRLRHDCAAIVAGDFAVVDKIHTAIREQEREIEEARQNAEVGRFFNVADKLFRARQFAECVAHLQQSPFKLSKIWQARLDYARRHA